MIIKFLVFCALASWFLYDGLYLYPQKTKQAEAYLSFIDSGRSMHDWPEYAAKQGLGKVEKEYTTEDVKNERQIREQFYWAAGLFGIGLIFIAKIFIDLKRTLSFDDEALISPHGKRVPLAAIREITTTKWENKGLGYVRYQEGDATELKKLILDDLKYKDAEKVLEHAQAYLGQELQSAKRKRLREQAEAEAAATASAESPDKSDKA